MQAGKCLSTLRGRFIYVPPKDDQRAIRAHAVRQADGVEHPALCGRSHAGGQRGNLVIG
jgi:hypothetical protein